MAKIELNHKLVLDIKEELTTKKIARPQTIQNGKSINYAWEEEYSVKYHLRGILTASGEKVVGKRYVVDFIEFLNGYVSKILEPDREYNYPIADYGFIIQIASATAKQSEALKLTIIKTEEVIYLKKIDCKMIVSKFHRAYSKCVDLGFELTD